MNSLGRIQANCSTGRFEWQSQALVTSSDKAIAKYRAHEMCIPKLGDLPFRQKEDGGKREKNSWV